MKLSKKRRMIIVSSLLLLFIALSGWGYSVYRLPSKVTVHHDESQLKLLGLRFEQPADPAKLTPCDLYRIIQDKYEGPLELCSSLNIDYQIATSVFDKPVPQSALWKNPKLPIDGHLERVPVYVATFTGVAQEFFGGPFNQVEQSRELNSLTVVFDATTGEALYNRYE